jgi:hypothetical protein
MRSSCCQCVTVSVFILSLTRKCSNKFVTILVLFIQFLFPSTFINISLEELLSRNLRRQRVFYNSSKTMYRTSKCETSYKVAEI